MDHLSQSEEKNLVCNRFQGVLCDKNYKTEIFFLKKSIPNTDLPQNHNCFFISTNNKQHVLFVIKTDHNTNIKNGKSYLSFIFFDQYLPETFRTVVLRARTLQGLTQISPPRSSLLHIVFDPLL